jgi:hypothetical protein
VTGDRVIGNHCGGQLKEDKMGVRGARIGDSYKRWMYNIKMYIKETGCEHVDWIQLAQDSSEQGNEPSCSVIGGNFDQLSICF